MVKIEVLVGSNFPFPQNTPNIVAFFEKWTSENKFHNYLISFLRPSRGPTTNSAREGLSGLAAFLVWVYNSTRHFNHTISPHSNNLLSSKLLFY